MIIGIDIRLLGKKRTGDETVFFNLTRSLIETDHDNEYLLFTDERHQEKIVRLKKRLGIGTRKNITIVSLLGHNRFLWNALTLPWYLLTHHVDIYHTQYIAPLFVPRRTRLAIHVHDVSFWAHPEWVRVADRFFLNLFLPHALKRATMVLVPSLFTREELVRYAHVSQEKIYVIPNAIDRAWLLPHSLESTVKTPLIDNLEKPYFVAVGTMQPRKNIAFLLEVFHGLQQKIPTAKLVLVGNPAGYHVDARVRAAYEEKDAGVIFSGYLEPAELRRLLAGSTAFVFPSLYEGFGIPILEAFAVGAPVAASDIPPSHEVAGEAALFFSPTRLVEAEKALYTLCVDDSLREKLRSQGKSRLQGFSWEKSARQLLSLYTRIFNQ